MKRNVTILCLFFSVILHLAARDTVEIGAAAGWGGFARTSGVEESAATGRLELMQPRIQPDAHTQLLLRFDSLPLVDESGRFAVERGLEHLSRSEFRHGGAAGAFQGEPVILSNQGADLFTPGSHSHGFTISFWLYSPRLQDGEEVLHWQGMHRSGERNLLQELRISVRNRRLQISFDNMFLSDELEPVSVELAGYQGLLPRRWSHHLVRYSAENGLLEYLVDGVLHDLAWVTAAGREDGGGFPLMIGELSGRRVQVGRRFVGLLDDLYISQQSTQESPPSTAGRTPGYAVTAPIDLGDSRRRLEQIQAETETPGDTAVRVQYRAGHRLRTDGEIDAAWQELPGDGRIPGQPAARFVQLRFDLLPDGEGRSPSVRQAVVRHRPMPPPIPPAGVRAETEAGNIQVEWNRVYDETVGGYLVYYGTEPGGYFGTGADAGDSPVDVGLDTRVVLAGLEPDVLYYITVVSYDRNDQGLESGFSREVRVRPARVEQAD
ncbi:LamG-like jellyroll fold domain-containing protein [Spirochaeta africana]|uniref:Fibronectin type III domain-containing protein n=1 Tax=Spirochaeta africana (strain ATCC 700263 / DSM 8902 / Z-7692) TaxID=889378 RepID=H9UME4_SPIAZ|nr:LamG-like jellyroll fold domain-containing protein [Spirochaeta africana]AFG38687.1 fibronectin type III domain-containing protein [Spirochaeta africana DSM 8902]